jgi:tetratricopeptide (TPR) repeat protein
MFKKSFIFTSILILSACATTKNVDDSGVEASTKKEKKESSGEDSTAKQDVKKLDMNYSKGFELSEKKGKFDCKKYTDFEKEEWENLVESALSCISDKDWVSLSKIADILSHNHLKAPWGPYYKSIVAYERFRDFQRAEWMCNLALKKSPNNPIINYQLARIYWNTERKPEAFDLMLEINKKDPENPSVLRFLGDVEYTDRNFKKALKYYEKIIPRYSRDLDFRAALATSLFYTDQKQQSLSHYKYAARNSKENGPYFYQIGEVYKSLKNWTLAKAYYLRAMKTGPTTRSIASLDLKKIKVQLDYVDQRMKESKEGGVKNEK